MAIYRLRVITVLFVVLAGVAAYSLFDRMILKKDEIVSTRYRDKKFTDLMKGLINEGIIKTTGEEIAIDEELLIAKGLNKKTADRVRRSIKFCYMKKDALYFDGQSVSVLNNRGSGDETVLRGSIMDRNGITLAKSTLDEKAWKLKREYTYGPEMFPVVGHYSAVYGSRYLEKELDRYLSGQSHDPIYLTTNDPFKKVRLGDEVTLTINNRIQKFAYDLMDGKKGAIVVLDVRTGEILAAVSTPSFDPNTKEGDTWRNTFADRKERLYENRAFGALYPPGSTFKTVVASAWIDRSEGKRQASSSLFQRTAADGESQGRAGHVTMCSSKKNRYDISDIHTHGRVDIDRALIVSCNQFFSEIGVTLGPEMVKYAEGYGFNRGIELVPQLKDLHCSATPSLALSWQEDQAKGAGIKTYHGKDFRRNPKIVAQGAIGQNLVVATPLQMAMVAAAIANKGTVLNPYLVKEIKTGDNWERIFSAKPVVMGKTVREETAERLRSLMARVMESGTGKNVKKVYIEGGKHTTSPKDNKSPILRVAGKTGTAEVGDRNNNGIIDPDENAHSWFIGFAPADNPRIAIAVIAENQGLGGLTAAPIAVEVMAEALNR
ncbi:MAG: hypothetical protein C0392_10260 [Syntrophus sp. (in: bacteria)]|nr:hypothetical protein [Syntrophus sp. (in: bacteria)]